MLYKHNHSGNNFSKIMDSNITIKVPLTVDGHHHGQTDEEPHIGKLLRFHWDTVIQDYVETGRAVPFYSTLVPGPLHGAGGASF